MQPIQSIEHCLLIQSVSRVIPADRPGLRRGCLQILRIVHGHQGVEPSVLQQQRGGFQCILSSGWCSDDPALCRVVSVSVRLPCIVLPEQVTSEIILQVAPDSVDVVRATL